MNINDRSWDAFTEEYALTYLHDADRCLPHKLADFAFSSFENPRVLDIGCGNARFYDILKESGKNFTYCGLEASTSLFEAANKIHSGSSNFEVRNVDFAYDGCDILDDSFDIAVMMHVFEISSSPERLFSIAQRASKIIAVIWYEYPRFDFTEIEIKEFVNHENASNGLVTPYLRVKYSRSYLEFLECKHSLKTLGTCSISEKDVLKIYQRKHEK